MHVGKGNNLIKREEEVATRRKLSVDAAHTPGASNPEREITLSKGRKKRMAKMHMRNAEHAEPLSVNSAVQCRLLCGSDADTSSPATNRLRGATFHCSDREKPLRLVHSREPGAGYDFRRTEEDQHHHHSSDISTIEYVRAFLINGGG
ncbi:uncharacterized protein FOMMEDRAFT_26915 [Fomitiporia mediterranea MF3/22]|uniref:uncharacterized protein n=1 Tax=Fomitiporia mediterranea (strain MF3/22) TaxID=694068 RepID=UPI0004409B6E|nr:uncharacterized protein FOMMEDRAFT_26915 [Fomitiporia mediterranea MF3/22]EJD06180.1 hypothetical protein FOMMEDRAFT_26915 [Fomitiporia mediterranea MF3/22]